MTDQLLGYINMAVGLVGIAVSIFTAPRIAGIGKAPPVGEGRGPALVHGLNLVGIFLVIVTFAFVLAIGMVLTLVPLVTGLGGYHPPLVSVLTVAALFALAATGALIMADNMMAIPAGTATVELAVLALLAAILPDYFLFILAGGFFLFLLVIFTFAAGAASEEVANERPASLPASELVTPVGKGPVDEH